MYCCTRNFRIPTLCCIPASAGTWIARYQQNREAEYVQRHAQSLRVIKASVKANPNLRSYEDTCTGA